VMDSGIERENEELSLTVWFEDGKLLPFFLYPPTTVILWFPDVVVVSSSTSQLKKVTGITREMNHDLVHDEVTAGFSIFHSLFFV
jgi:hypothetical protein